MYEWKMNVFILKVIIWCEDVICYTGLIWKKKTQNGDWTRTWNTRPNQTTQYHTQSHFSSQQIASPCNEVLLFVAVCFVLFTNSKLVSKSNEKIACRSLLVVSHFLEKLAPAVSTASEKFGFVSTLIHLILWSVFVLWSKSSEINCSFSCAYEKSITCQFRFYLQRASRLLSFVDLNLKGPKWKHFAFSEDVVIYK